MTVMCGCSSAEFCVISGIWYGRQLNPSAALQILERGQEIDFLLVDYAMPEMNALAVMDRARACQPAIKTLLITGYPEVLRSNPDFEIPILPKPFKPSELSRRVAEMLNGRSSGDSSDGCNFQR